MDWSKMSEEQKTRKMETKRNGRLQYRINNPLPVPEPIDYPMFTMDDINEREIFMIEWRFRVDNGKKLQRAKDKKIYCKKYQARIAEKKKIRAQNDPIYRERIRLAKNASDRLLHDPEVQANKQRILETKILLAKEKELKHSLLVKILVRSKKEKARSEAILKNPGFKYINNPWYVPTPKEKIVYTPEYIEELKERQRLSQKKRHRYNTEILSDAIIRAAIGIKKSDDFPYDYIEAKRTAIKMWRYCKENKFPD